MRQISLINIITIILTMSLLVRIADLYSGIDSVQRHVDESCWMHGAYFYNLFFLKRDFSNEDWYSFISYNQPVVGEYILGAALHIKNHKIIDTGEGIMGWFSILDRSPAYKRLLRPVPGANPAKDRKRIEFYQSLLGQMRPASEPVLEPEDYKVGRITMLSFGVLATALLVMICSCIFKHPLPGVLAGILFLNNGITIPTFQQVMVDPICCFFVLSALFVLIRLSRRIGQGGLLHGEIIPLLVLEGILLALALGTKFITAYMAATVTLVFMTNIALDIMKVKQRKERAFALRAILQAGMLILILACAVVVFVLLDPSFYHDPTANIAKMIEHRRNFIEMPGIMQFPVIGSFPEKIGMIFSKGVVLGYSFHNLPEKLIYICVFLTGTAALTKKSFDEISAGFTGRNAFFS